MILTKDTKPDLIGTTGKAWLMHKEADDRPDVQGCLDAWVVHAPNTHPFWDHYMIVCIYLRDIEGVPPAKITLEGATHEVSVVALQPDKDYPLDGSMPLLMPLNYVAQWVAESDEEAHGKVEACVKEVINGLLSPDTDFRREWDARFKNDN